MNRDQAKLELDATTLRPQDASEEALALAREDAELAQWLAARRAFDEKVAEIYAPTVAIPEDLREQLHQMQHRRLRPTRWLPTLALAAAAALVLGWTLFWPDPQGLPAWQAESLAAVHLVEHGMSRLDQRTSEWAQVRRYLAEKGAPRPQELPSMITGKKTFGCKTILVHGQPATIICFQLDGGKEAHLVVMENAGLTEAPPETLPQLTVCQEWNLAAWSDGRQRYLLATTAEVGVLKKLLGLA